VRIVTIYTSHGPPTGLLSCVSCEGENDRYWPCDAVMREYKWVQGRWWQRTQNRE
jgi:hypothetical protein